MPLEHNLSIVEEADVVTHLFNLFHPVSRKEDGFSCRFQLNDDLLEQLTINRIQATERFIKYVDIGIVNDRDRKSTRLNSSHVAISYAVFCLKKKKKITR